MNSHTVGDDGDAGHRTVRCGAQEAGPKVYAQATCSAVFNRIPPNCGTLLQKEATSSREVLTTGPGKARKSMQTVKRSVGGDKSLSRAGTAARHPKIKALHGRRRALHRAAERELPGPAREPRPGQVGPGRGQGRGSGQRGWEGRGRPRTRIRDPSLAADLLGEELPP